MAKGIEVRCPKCENKTLIDPTYFETKIWCSVCSNRYIADAEAQEAALREDPEDAARESFAVTERDEAAAWWCYKCRTYVAADTEVCPFCGCWPNGDPAFATDEDFEAYQQRMVREVMERPVRERRKMILRGLMFLWGLLMLQGAGLAILSPQFGFTGFLAGAICMAITYNSFRGNANVLYTIIPCVGVWLFLMLIGTLLAWGNPLGYVLLFPVVVFVFLIVAQTRFS